MVAMIHFYLINLFHTSKIVIKIPAITLKSVTIETNLGGFRKKNKNFAWWEFILSFLMEFEVYLLSLTTIKRSWIKTGFTWGREQDSEGVTRRSSGGAGDTPETEGGGEKS